MNIKIDEKDFARLLEEWFKTADLNSDRFLWNNQIARVLKAGVTKQDRWKNAARGWNKKKIEVAPAKVEPPKSD